MAYNPLQGPEPNPDRGGADPSEATSGEPDSSETANEGADSPDPTDDAMGAASILVDEISQECAVCGESIPAGEEYVSAAYGPVHKEPCSHMGRSEASPATDLL